MKCYHVITLKKLEKYKRTGFIKPPVRAWKNIEDAETFSCQTGRRVILRLVFSKWKLLEGHKNRAIVTDSPVLLDNC